MLFNKLSYEQLIVVYRSFDDDEYATHSTRKWCDYLHYVIPMNACYNIENH